MADFSIQKAGITHRDNDGLVRQCVLVFTEGALVKSVIANDGFRPRDFSLDSTAVNNSGWYFIDAIRASGASTVTIQGYKTAEKDAVTPVELAAAANKYGPKYTRHVSDNLLPVPQIFIKSGSDTQYITYVADNPCTMEITIMYNEEEAGESPL